MEAYAHVEVSYEKHSWEITDEWMNEHVLQRFTVHKTQYKLSENI